MEHTIEITMLKQKVDKQGKEIEDLRRELDAVKSIVKANNAITEASFAKLSLDSLDFTKFK